ncbi:hypothetical protein G7Y89_g2192 [Cudoniella acicularis]|uniref:GAT domain-containing protein n=1 Tax=Cudoniella acicularis TaxID=354080 RepID=A0A8H4RUZ1_9HELO|nr:hypothetical protein G7Y89_g2192 [Cudoniella acicularis]
MKAMKSMNVNRMLGSLKRRPRDEAPSDAPVDPQSDTPEAAAMRNVRLFCESGGPNGSGEEVLFLPSIVEACESSPSAAKESAYLIRKFLSKDHFSKPYIQYNAIMLIRILADNPGKTFTRNIDTKFVQTVKELLRVGRDPSVKQILMETLDTFQRDKAADEGCFQLNEMWKKEHERMLKIHGPGGPRTMNAPPFDPNAQNYFSRNHHSRRLPPPHELSSRIEEARTSAQLLSQTVQSTPPSELLQNDLVREFADRCQSASRSIQAYMIAENPSPDNDTMETLIETNEQLAKAMSQHQRAVLSARKLLGLGTPGEGNTPPPQRTESGFAPPPGPLSNQNNGIILSQPPLPSARPSRRTVAPQIPPPGDYLPTDSSDHESENPFADPTPSNKATASSSSRPVKPPFPEDKPPTLTGQFNDRLGIEPYHPGFKETPSYMGRQDSSVGKVTMHAANQNPSEEDDVDEETAREYGIPAEGQAAVYRY